MFPFQFGICPKVSGEHECAPRATPREEWAYAAIRATLLGMRDKGAWPECGPPIMKS